MCEILCLVHNLTVAEFHNAHFVRWPPLVGDCVSVIQKSPFPRIRLALKSAGLRGRSAKPANCSARGFVAYEDIHKWHLLRKYRVPRLHRRPATPASLYSELHVFVALA